MGPLDENDRVEYSLSVSNAGEFWVKLSANVQVRPGENGVQTADRAEKFVDAMLQAHIADLKRQLRP